MPVRIVPSAELNLFDLAGLNVSYNIPRWEYTRSEIEEYFISPKREFVSMDAHKQGYKALTNEEDPDQEVKAYCKNIYIGDSKTLLNRMDSDASLGPGVKKKARRLIRKNIIEAFTDAADVKITPRKPTLLQRLLYTFNRCIGRQTA